VSDFQAIVEAEKDNVNAWFAEKIEYASEIYDSYYKEHLLQTLHERQNQILEQLDARKAEASSDAANANQLLADLLDNEEYLLHDHNQSTLESMEHFNEDLELRTAAAAASINADFHRDSNEQDFLKNQYLDQLRRDWAYWLKYLFAYSGYETSLYAHYDDTVDYSATLFADEANGTYLDLGYQGINSGNSGVAHLGGFGYGGQGGIDYLYASDNTGLAYGSNTGPSTNPDFGFDDSILDPDTELTSLLAGYTSGYGFPTGHY
jgi:hypothetical protein